MRLFLDANILVAVINQEYPVYPYAAKVLSLNDKKGVRIYTSAVCLAIAYYFAEKKHGSRGAKEKISLLAKHIEIATCGKKEAICAAEDVQILDYEDGLEYFSAKHAGCNFIVTEDTTDFYFASMEVYAAEDFLKIITSRN